MISSSHQPHSRRGQAMVEFVIAILAIVIVVSGLFQFIELAAEKGKIVSGIRADAGKKAIGNGSIIDTPEYIVEWDAEDDEMRHTADDSKTTGSIASTLGMGVVDRSASDSAEWEYLDGTTNSAIARLHFAPTPSALGMIRERQTKTIELYPAMREWIVGRDTVTVGSEVWMPKLTIGGFDE